VRRIPLGNASGLSLMLTCFSLVKRTQYLIDFGNWS
jgi:hypothetical protein